MSFWLQILANAEMIWSWMRRTVNTCRVRVLVPNTIRAGYSMGLTYAGYWTPLSTSLEGMSIFYDATSHRVSIAAATETEAEARAWRRWDWIGATGATGADYGEFFAGLRVERGIALTAAQAIALAVHQTGQWPGLTLRVTTRMGEEQEVSVSTGAPIVSAAPTDPDVNYIR